MNLLTGWFPPEVPPVHIGVYRVWDFPSASGQIYAFWDGKAFLFRSLSPYGADVFRREPTSQPRRTTWRGLARKPK